MVLESEQVINPYLVPGIIRKVEFFKVGNLQKGEKIISNICEYMGCPVEKVKSKDRFGELVYVRQWCFWFLVHETNLSLKKIGELMGGRDHATVIHNKNVVRGQLESRADNQYKQDFPYVRKVVLFGVDNNSHKPPKRKSIRRKSVEEIIKPIVKPFTRPAAIYSNKQFNL
jgi:hypothetical protein